MNAKEGTGNPVPSLFSVYSTVTLFAKFLG